LYLDYPLEKDTLNNIIHRYFRVSLVKKHSIVKSDSSGNLVAVARIILKSEDDIKLLSSKAKQRQRSPIVVTFYYINEAGKREFKTLLLEEINFKKLAHSYKSY